MILLSDKKQCLTDKKELTEMINEASQVGVELKKGLWNMDFAVKQHTIDLTKKIERTEL